MTTTAAVLALLLTGRWQTPYEMREEILQRYGICASESSITARARELRTPKFGSMEVIKRPRDGSKAYEYSLQLDAQKSLF
jgi:hypothetical protein